MEHALGSWSLAHEWSHFGRLPRMGSQLPAVLPLCLGPSPATRLCFALGPLLPVTPDRGLGSGTERVGMGCIHPEASGGGHMSTVPAPGWQHHGCVGPGKPLPTTGPGTTRVLVQRFKDL